MMVNTRSPTPDNRYLEDWVRGLFSPSLNQVTTICMLKMQEKVALLPGVTVALAIGMIRASSSGEGKRQVSSYRKSETCVHLGSIELSGEGEGAPLTPSLN